MGKKKARFVGGKSTAQLSKIVRKSENTRVLVDPHGEKKIARLIKKVDPELLLAVIIEAEILNEIDGDEEWEAMVETASGKAAKKIVERFKLNERS